MERGVRVRGSWVRSGGEERKSKGEWGLRGERRMSKWELGEEWGLGREGKKSKGEFGEEWGLGRDQRGEKK